MSNTYQQLSFTEIKHKLPKDCWAYQRNEKKNGELENGQMLYFNGNTQLGHLNLDDVLGLQEKGETDFILLVVVEGNLAIDNYIYNQDTDGATGLIVLGNLTAKNMVVGGQEIYITGNLQVAELFWGDYNHGSLKVNGNITAHTFIATDYHFNADRFRQKDRVAVRHWLWDEQDIMDNTALTGLLDEECLILDDEDDPVIDREKMLEYFEAGRPVVKTTAEELVPFVFESRLFNHTNLQRLLQSPLFQDVPVNESDRTQSIEYWRGEDYKRVTIIKGEPYSIRVYFQQQNKAFLAGYIPVAGDDATGERPQYRIGTAVRIVVDDILKDVNSHWQEYNPAVPGHQDFAPMAEAFWDKLLDEWSEMEYWQNKFAQTITSQKITEILTLPVVKGKYRSDDEGAEALWEGFYNWVFTEGNDEEGNNPCISILKQLTSGDDDEDENFEIYHFKLETGPANVVRAVLQTTDDDDEESYIVPVDDIEKYRNAIRYFEIMYRRMPQLNKEYIKEQKGGLSGAVDAPDGVDDHTKSLIKNTLDGSNEDLTAKQSAMINALPESNEPYPWQGHIFTRISARQAREILLAVPHDDSNLWNSQWDNPNPEHFWLLAEGDVTVDTLELYVADGRQPGIGGIIICGNLSVKFYIDGSHSDNCWPLVVLGNVVTTAICFTRTSHFVMGSLTADMLLGEYNDGYLVVKGDVHCKVICTDDYPMHLSGLLRANIVLGNTIFVKSVKQKPAKISRKDVFIPEVLFRTATHDLYYPELFEYVKDGKSVLLMTAL